MDQGLGLGSVQKDDISNTIYLQRYTYTLSTAGSILTNSKPRDTMRKFVPDSGTVHYFNNYETQFSKFKILG